MLRVSRRWVELFALATTMVASGCSGSRSPAPISVKLSPTSSQVVDQSQTVELTAIVTNDPLGGGVSWSLTGLGSLTNANASSVRYTPPMASLASSQKVTVTATSIADNSKSASVQITVNPYLRIPSQALASGSVGQPYSQTIALTGGTPPFQWSVYDGPIITGWRVGGSVPDGLTLNASSGVISGTPTGGGTWYFEGTVTDAVGETAVNGFLSIRINPITTAANPVPFLNQPLVPTAASPGSADFTLHVSGTGFVSGATIDFNHAPLATTFVNSQHLTAMVPAAEVATAGTASVTVVNPAPGGGPSNVIYFQVAAPEATVSFAAPNSPLPIYELFGITAGDFNEDGKADLAITGSVKVYLLLGNGDGTFAPAAGSPMPVPSPPYDDFGTPYVGPISAGDFNNSGHLGLAVGEFQNEAAVMLLGNGDGTFLPSSATFANALGMPISAVEPADFNADGNLDLAIANQISGQSPVLLGYGKGAFNAAADLYTVGFPTGVAVGDFNGDGKLDAAEAGGGSTAYPDSGVAVSLGNGDGTFTEAIGSPLSLGQSLSAIVTGDFNGDGKLDLAVTDAGGNTVTILLGNGDGTFGPPIAIAVGNQPDGIVAGDFNNDGKLDLAVANYADGTITLLLGNGDGTFTPATGSPYRVGNGPYQMAAEDFNGDGKLDLAVTNLTDGTVSILLQQ